jgi:hypothetical protein
MTTTGGHGLAGSRLALTDENRARTILVVATLALALGVAGLIFLLEITSQGELRGSLFGQIVLLRLAPYHLLAAAAAFFAAGALALDAALITVERRLPVIGTLRATGWRRREVARMIAMEIVTPALQAAAIASLALTSIGLAAGSGLTLLLAIVGGVFAVAILVGLLAAAMPIQLALTALPWTAMRAEGASSTVSGLAPRQALVTLSALVIAVALVSTGWSAAEMAGKATPPFAQPAKPGLGPTAARIRTDVAAVTGLPGRTPGSPNSEAALAYVSDQLAGTGYSVTWVAYPAAPEFADAQGQPLNTSELTVDALAFDPDVWDGTALTQPIDLLDQVTDIESLRCPKAAVLMRLRSWKQAPMAAQLEQRCKASSSIVIGVHGNDGPWSDFAAQVASVRVAAAHFLMADATETAGATPWLVATLDASEQGATESAAPVAVAVEVARRAAQVGLPLRVAIGTGTDTAATSLLIQYLAPDRAAPVIWLGPMGGPASLIIGTETIDEIDAVATQAVLLRVTAVGDDFDNWLAKTSALSAVPTSARLLDLLATATTLPVTDDGGENVFALPLGIDTAWLGEPVAMPDIRSVAGTSLDTIELVDPRRLDGIAAALVEVIGSL